MSISNINNSTALNPPVADASGSTQFTASLQQVGEVAQLIGGDYNLELGGPSAYLVGVKLAGNIKGYVVTTNPSDWSQATLFGSFPTGQNFSGMPLAVVGTYNPHLDGSHSERMQVGLGVTQGISVPSFGLGGSPVTVGGMFANVRIDGESAVELYEAVSSALAEQSSEGDFGPGGIYEGIASALTSEGDRTVRLTVGVALSIPGLLASVTDPATATKLSNIQKYVSPNVAVSWNLQAQIVDGELYATYNGRNIPIKEFMNLLQEDVIARPLNYITDLAEPHIGPYVNAQVQSSIGPLDQAIQDWQNDFSTNLPNFGNPTVAQINNNFALNEGMANIWHLSKPDVSGGRNHGDPVLAFANTAQQALREFGNPILHVLSAETRTIITSGGANSYQEMQTAVNEIMSKLTPERAALMAEWLSNDWEINFGNPRIDAENKSRSLDGTGLERARTLLLSAVPDELDPDSVFASIGEAYVLGDSGEIPSPLFDDMSAETADLAPQLTPEQLAELELQMMGDATGVGVVPADPLPSAEVQAAQIASYVHQFTSLASQFTPIPGMVLNATGLTAAGLALNATENPTFSDAVPLMRQILSMIPLDDDVEKAISVAGTAWDLGSAAKAGNWGNVGMIAAQVAAGQIGPRTGAGVAAGIALIDVVASVANPVKLGLAVARFALALNNFVNTFNRVKIDMGEVDVGNGVTADVRYQGFTSSTGPEYRFVLAGDQENLPPLQSASFSLRRADDGSFRFSGSGSRAPFGIGVEALGRMTTPEAPSDPEGLRQPDSLYPGMLQPFHIDTDLAHRLITMNGGRQTFSNIDASFPLFNEIEALFESWQLDTVYTTNAKEGLPQVADVGFGEFGLVSFPDGLPEVGTFDDQVVAHFLQPGMMDHKLHLPRPRKRGPLPGERARHHLADRLRAGSDRAVRAAARHPGHDRLHHDNPDRPATGRTCSTSSRIWRRTRTFARISTSAT